MTLDEIETAIRLSKDAGHSKIKLNLNVVEKLVKRIRTLEDPIQLFGKIPGRRRDKLEVKEGVVT